MSKKNGSGNGQDILEAVLIGGNQYSSLDDCQAIMLEPLTQSLVETIRRGIENGNLLIVDNIIQCPDNFDKNHPLQYDEKL
ncbi:MAG: hypothetical protein AAF485_16130 [Chloroflexota bacterium]